MINEKKRSEIYYLNDDREIVPKEYATNIIIRVLNPEGDLVEETFMRKVPTAEQSSN